MLKYVFQICAFGLLMLGSLLAGCEKQPEAAMPMKTDQGAEIKAATEPATSPATQASALPPTNTKCPFCGGPVDPNDQSLNRAVYKGKTYVFCCYDCKEGFLKDPEKTLAQIAGDIAAQKPAMDMGKGMNMDGGMNMDKK